MRRPMFTPEELAEIAAADAEIAKTEPDREKNLERRRKYYKKNKARCDESTRKWRKNNPEKVKAANRRRYAKHREKILAYNRQYYRNNQERLREYQRKRYAAKKAEKLDGGAV